MHVNALYAETTTGNFAACKAAGWRRGR